MMEKRNVATSRRAAGDGLDDADIDAAVSLFGSGKRASARTEPCREAVAADEESDEDTLSGE